jgi:predicted permease
MLVESLLLATAGPALGAGLAQLLSRFLIAFLSTEGSPLFMDLRPDWRVLGFTAGLAVLTCVLFGLAPALRSTRVAPVSVLKAAGRGMTSGPERFGLRRGLVVIQVALSLVLLVGALLFVRTLRNLLTLDPGFHQNDMVVANLDLTRLNIAKERRQEFKRELLDRIRALPGIDSAADVGIVPISGNSWNDTVFIEGSDNRKAVPWFNRVTPGYFNALRTPFLAGRDFDDHDTATSLRVAIVNETFARKFLNGQNAISVTFRQESYVGRPTPTYQIVGLVKDAKYVDLREEPVPLVYLVAAQDDRPDNFPQFLIRSNVPVASALPAIKQAVSEASPEIMSEFHTLQSQIRDSLMRERLMATLSGFFGFLAVLLATVGLYGVISYTVARRTNEIGIRVALGAQRGHVIGMIMREAAVLLAIGLVLGSALALAASRTATSLLFGLKPNDPVTLALAVAALAAVATAASFLPAHRATRLDPMAALREE